MTLQNSRQLIDKIEEATARRERILTATSADSKFRAEHFCGLIAAGIFDAATDYLDRLAGDSKGFVQRSSDSVVWSLACLLYETKKWSTLDQLRGLLSGRSDSIRWRVHVRCLWAQYRESGFEGTTLKLDAPSQLSQEALADWSHWRAYQAYRQDGDSVRAIHLLEPAIGIYRLSGEHTGLIRCLILRSMLHRNAGLLASSTRDVDEALAVAESCGNLHLAREAMRQSAIVSYRRSQFQWSDLLATGAMEIKADGADSTIPALAMIRARVAMYLSNTEAAGSFLDRARRELNATQTNARLWAILREHDGLLHLAKQEPQEALESFNAAAQLLAECKIQSYEAAEIELRRSEALIALADYAAALRHADAGLGRLADITEALERGHLLRCKGIALHFVGRPTEAAVQFVAAEAELRRVGDHYELGRLLLDKAELGSTSAESRVADASEALNIFERIKLPNMVARATDILALARMRLDRDRAVESIEADLHDSHIIAASEKTKRILADCDQIACHDGTVLITGETGVGKEIFARYVHDRSDRSGNQFIAVNCAAIPETLFEREFFGNKKGAFTGADVDRPGLVHLANGGSLFLDEVGEMPLSMQPKLLRLLQEGTFRRVGDVEESRVDIRFIAATNVFLRKQVERKEFREDLFYRLRWFEYEIPPLRKRKADVVALIKHVLKRESKKHGVTYWIDKQSWLLLKRHTWPGNVRELEAAVCSAAARSGDDGCITARDLPAELAIGARSESRRLPLQKELEVRERELILEALAACDYQRSDAAIALGIGRNTLYEKMKKLGIKPEKR